VDPAARRKLVEQHMGLVRKLALKVFRDVRDHVELDDLISLGTEGLIDAADRFDPTLAVRFDTYAYYRVRGAIYDGIRKMAHLPIGLYRKHLAVARASELLENLEQKAQGAATQAEAAAAADKAAAMRSMFEAMRSAATVYVTSLDAMRARGGDVVEGSADPEAQLITARLRARVARAIAALPERERQMLIKHYYEDKQLTVAGQELGMSKSWASRLHARAIEMLRDELADDG
jgi:RNA polymerase sigma factor FliA